MDNENTQTESEQVKVIIHCLVYNHEPYLRDCLEGFVMQQTNFPFKAVVHDDCSTDNSAAIIREYAEKYPHIIEPIYETENQWRKGTLDGIMDNAILGRSPYIAYCEGDDYWTDPLKLQKQVDYMDEHPECSMTCTNAEILTPTGILSEDFLIQSGWERPTKTSLLRPEDIIKKGGLHIYLHTCTKVIKANLLPEIRRVLKPCAIADYPLQIMAALNGIVFYFHDKTACYRYANPGSWTEKIQRNTTSTGNYNIRIKNSLLQILANLNQYSKNKYSKDFISTQVEIVIHCLHSTPNKQKNIVLRELGWAIKYDYVSQNTQKQFSSFYEKVVFSLKRILVWPYYPFPNALKLILPAWHPVVVLAKLLGK